MSGRFVSKRRDILLACEQLIFVLHMQVVLLHGVYMTLLVADNGALRRRTSGRFFRLGAGLVSI